jgi:hypothetical protein
MCNNLRLEHCIRTQRPCSRHEVAGRRGTSSHQCDWSTLIPLIELRLRNFRSSRNSSGNSWECTGTISRTSQEFLHSRNSWEVIFTFREDVNPVQSVSCLLCYVVMPLLPPGAQSLRPRGPGCQRLSVTLLSSSVTLRWYQSADRAPKQAIPCQVWSKIGLIIGGECM